MSGASLRDRAAGLRPQPASQSSRSSIASASGLPADLLEFVWDRLDFDKTADLSKSCLAEDWFVEAALDRGSPFRWRRRDAEVSHRLLYRHARTLNLIRTFERGSYQPESARLLLNQMVLLLPAMFSAAREIATAQGISAFGQDPKGLEAKPAGPVPEGNAP